MNKAMQLKDKIKNLALKNHIPAQAVLQNFMLERLLERISVSEYREAFILKGGMLIASMVGISNRTTMDMDATLRNQALSEEMVREAFSEICAVPLEDGVTFALDHILPIREEDEYGGYRVAVMAKYESINTPLKIDITTGDVITPRAVRYEYPSLFSNRRIAYLGYAHSGRTNLKRLTGYREQMQAAGAAVLPGYELEAQTSDPQGGLDSVRHFLALPEPPTAIFCYNDMLAIGVLRGLKDAGLDVPGDCSVAGFDNITFSAFTTPPLTTFDQPKRTIGVQAARLVLGLLDPGVEGEAPGQKIQTLKGSLLVRASTAAPGK